jgi:hypothetical protein
MTLVSSLARLLHLQSAGFCLVTGNAKNIIDQFHSTDSFGQVCIKSATCNNLYIPAKSTNANVNQLRLFITMAALRKIKNIICEASEFEAALGHVSSAHYSPAQLLNNLCIAHDTC